MQLFLPEEFLENNIVIFFSSLKEANALLNQSVLKFIKEDSFYTSNYKDKKIVVYISGIGRVKTTDFLDNTLIPANCRSYKFGTCGITDPEIPLLKIVIPQYVSFENHEIKTQFEERLRDFYIESRLLTSETPIFDEEMAKNLCRKGYGLVDMESFFIMNRYKTIPVITGTDRCCKESKDIFFANLNKASFVLKNFLEKVILKEE